jgi:ATP-dependent Clp protease, protease subunit
MFTELISSHTGQKLSTVEKDMDRNKWMTPDEALKYGLIDKIIN